MASAGPRGRSRDNPMTRMRISVSSNRGTSEQRRRKKLKGKNKTKKQLNQVALLETVRGKPFLRRKENSLPVALWRPVVPLVIRLRLLCEKHFVKAADKKDNIHIKAAENRYKEINPND